MRTDAIDGTGTRCPSPVGVANDDRRRGRPRGRNPPGDAHRIGSATQRVAIKLVRDYVIGLGIHLDQVGRGNQLAIHRFDQFFGHPTGAAAEASTKHRYAGLLHKGPQLRERWQPHALHVLGHRRIE